MSRKGVPNHQRDEVDATKSRCKRCGSTERSRYFRTTEMESPNGKGLFGERVTHIVWRACKCLACGQHRVDKSYENRVRILPAQEVKPIEKSDDVGHTSETGNVDNDVLF